MAITSNSLTYFFSFVKFCNLTSKESAMANLGTNFSLLVKAFPLDANAYTKIFNAGFPSKLNIFFPLFTSYVGLFAEHGLLTPYFGLSYLDFVASYDVTSSFTQRFITFFSEYNAHYFSLQRFTPTTISNVLNAFYSSTEEDNLANKGRVIGFKDSIVTISGLSAVMLNELIHFSGGASGLVLNLETSLVRALVFGSATSVVVGELVTTSGFVMRTPVSELYLGRIVDSLAKPIDGLGVINSSEFMSIERKAPGVITRKKVSEPVITGVKVIDALVPIGRGQRELVLGDRKTGKTMLVIDSILNQTKTFLTHEFPLICIYVAIGKRKTEVNRLWKIIKDNGSDAHTIFVVASSSDPASLQFIAPYVGCTLAESFSFNSGHTLIIYDDLSKHADVYRQISLLLRRPVGREAYPGDVFYLHSRLLERAIKLNENFGEGSMTALPIIETIQGDVSAYIPTNIISITDGQIYLDWDRHQQGIRPAIDPGISVSRIGTSAQVEYMRKLAGSLKLELAQYREVEQFSKLGSELDAQTLKMLHKGQLLTEILKQRRNQPLSLSSQIFNLFIVNRTFPKVTLEFNLLDAYVRFLPIFMQYSAIFAPYSYILNLTNKIKRIAVPVDLQFLANTFWKLYFFRDVLVYGSFPDALKGNFAKKLVASDLSFNFTTSTF